MPRPKLYFALDRKHPGGPTPDAAEGGTLRRVARTPTSKRVPPAAGSAPPPLPSLSSPGVWWPASSVALRRPGPRVRTGARPPPGLCTCLLVYPRLRGHPAARSSLMPMAWAVVFRRREIALVDHPRVVEGRSSKWWPRTCWRPDSMPMSWLPVRSRTAPPALTLAAERRRRSWRRPRCRATKPGRWPRTAGQVRGLSRCRWRPSPVGLLRWWLLADWSTATTARSRCC